jgi:putative colanic acid biosynthesis UDP-glucose lipid carrier transferase
MNGVPVVGICETPFTGTNELLKRVSDIVLATIILILISPILLVLAIGVKLSSPGPVIFKQRRNGLDGGEIIVYKFRSMTAQDNGPVVRQATKDDPRITRFGAFIRRTSLDELPQLWTVVRGDMSLIGPRPTLRYQVERYSDRQRRRLEVLPGITGWAQIHGRASLPWADRIELDLWYVRHHDWKTDLLILLRTPLALFGGTYKGKTGGWQA